MDPERCIWLAKRGRRFQKLKFIQLQEEDFSWKEFRVLSEYHFPKLDILWLDNMSPALLKPHSGLRELLISIVDPDDLQFVTEGKYPRLSVLIISDVNDMDDQPVEECRLTHLQ